MTGSYFRGDAVPVLAPHDEANFDTVTYTYYEQLKDYEDPKQLDLTGTPCERCWRDGPRPYPR